MGKQYFSSTVRRHTGNVEISAFDDARVFLTERVANMLGNMRPEDVVLSLEIALVEPKSISHQMKVFRKYVPVLLDLYDMSTQALIASCKQAEELQGSLAERSKKRYTPEEDEAIISTAAEGDTLVAIALAVGRTPTAIQTRISHLVGIGKISQSVAGRFIGTINGSQIDAEIDGVVYKQHHQGGTR